MGSVNTNFLPASTGLSLGSSSQQWNAFLALVNNATPVGVIGTGVPFSATPSFVATSQLAVFSMTLIGDVASSTFSGPILGITIFQILQDAVGGRNFAWPANFVSTAVVGSDPNQSTIQVFYFDGNTGFAITPGVLYP